MEISEKVSFIIVTIICMCFFAFGFITYDMLFSEKESINTRITQLEKNIEKKTLPHIYITHGVIYKTEGDILIEDMGGNTKAQQKTNTKATQASSSPSEG